MTCIYRDKTIYKRCYLPIQIIDYHGEMKVRLAPSLACDMVFGRNWFPIYDVLEWVRETKMKYQHLRYNEVWLGEDKTPVPEEQDEGFDIRRVASSTHFQQAQRDNSDLRKIFENEVCRMTSQRMTHVVS